MRYSQLETSQWQTYKRKIFVSCLLAHKVNLPMSFCIAIKQQGNINDKTNKLVTYLNEEYHAFLEEMTDLSNKMSFFTGKEYDLLIKVLRCTNHTCITPKMFRSLLNEVKPQILRNQCQTLKRFVQK